jgi:hypothetical protein
MGSLRLSSTKDLAQDATYNVLLYGENGSGKTHFAGTWPNPVFLVPTIARGEMRTWSLNDIPVVFFNSMDDLKDQLEALGKAIEQKKVVCKTIVLDNLTTTQMLFEDEIKKAFGVDKLEWEHWGRFTSFFVRLMTTIKKWPVHSLWICHSDKDRTFTLKGDSRNFFPGNADLLLYCESKDLRNKGLQWFVHGRKFGTWPARMRLAAAHENNAGFARVGPDPHYDDFAEILGLPNCATIEGR